MKPEYLSLKNFGPFRGEHTADFAALGDFFLICGETGAGKTTLFDAIAYAFYGDVPGARKGLSKQMRCQYAENDDESYVELTFSLGRETWRIRRTLPQDRMGARKKTLQTVPEQVSLEKRTSDGWRNESDARKTDTDNKILALIKLTAEEFAKIVLLPQGDFARFLQQNSEDRRIILSKLFPVSIYKAAAEYANEKAKSLKNILDEIENHISALRTEFNPETFETEKNSLEKERADLKNAYNAHLNALREKAALLETVKRIAKNTAELEAAENEYEADITANEAAYGEWKRTLSDAERAFPVAPLIVRHKTICEDLQSHTRQLQEKRSLLQKAEEECETIRAGRETVNAARKTLNELIARQPNMESAVSAAEKIKENERNAADLETQLKTIRSEYERSSEKVQSVEVEIQKTTNKKIEIEVLTEAKTRAAVNYENVKRKKQATIEYVRQKENLKEMERAIENLENERRGIEDEIKKCEDAIAEIQKAYSEKKNSDMAGVLAQTLEANTPCPVCGSIHHPAPAVAKPTDHVIAYEKQTADLNAQKNALEEKRGELLQKSVKTNAEREANAFHIQKREEAREVFSNEEEADENEIRAAEKKEQTERDFNDAKRILSKMDSLRTEKENLEKNLSQNEKAMSKIENDVNLLRQTIQNETDRFTVAFPGLEVSVEKAKDERGKCLDEANRLRNFISDFEDKEKKALDEKSRNEGSVSELETVCARLSEKRRKSEDDLQNGCAAAGFSNAVEAENAVLDEKRKAQLREKTASFENEKRDLEHRIAFLKKELAKEGEYEKHPGQETVEKEYSEIETLIEQNGARMEQTTGALLSLNEKMKNWQSLTDQYAAKTNEFNTLQAVSADIQGRNPRNVKLEAWILSKYLEEVTEYANTRISRMSDGRYRIQTGGNFKKGNSKTGLDLEIFDSYTGKTRPTGTLSGGETFMASISLALGLADSIQARAGGILLEAVFIDEGFGTLDESCLELAMNIFDEIRGQRTVGIISHVKELRDRIPQKLVVKKNATEGSFIQQE